jgi:hypothetical protein
VDHLIPQSGLVPFNSDRVIDPVPGTLAYNAGEGAVRTLTEPFDVGP